MSAGSQVRLKWGSTLGAPMSARRARRVRQARAVPSLPPNRLTPRQLEVSRWISLGKSNKEIAHLVGLTEGTVKIVAADAKHRAGQETRLGLALWYRDTFGATQGRTAADLQGADTLVGGFDSVRTSCFE